jgi:hypothetical protein
VFFTVDEEGLTGRILMRCDASLCGGEPRLDLAAFSANECAVLRHIARLPMSRPIDEAVAARARGKFVAGTGDRQAAVEDPPTPFRECEPLSAFQLDRILTLDEVAEFTGLSEDGIRRHYSHLILRLSPRRVGIRLRHALTIGKPPENPTPGLKLA